MRCGARADVAQPVERILGKDEVHEFDSRHQLHLKPPSLIDSEGGFAIYCLFFEGLLPEGSGPFFVCTEDLVAPNCRFVSFSVSFFDF